MKNNQKAFTLVELIVVIVILSILGTISFISMESYGRSSRNSVRISDVKKMESGLELFSINARKYPDPTWGVPVTYSWSEVWTQWVFWDSVITNIKTIDKAPKDPLVQNLYTYSRLNTKLEFEIWAMLEGDALTNNIIEWAYAEAADDAVSYIHGTYNWVVAKVYTWGLNYVLAVPTIISSDLGDSDVLNIISNLSLAFNGSDNIAASYQPRWYTSTGGFDYNSATPSNIVVYSTSDLDDLSTDWQNLRDLTTWLQTAYSWTSIENETIYASILNINTNVDAEVVSVVWYIVNNELWWNIEIVNVVQWAINTWGYASSETSGWIEIWINVDWSTITGYSESETLWWICFDASCDSTVTRDVPTWNLSWYALSEVFGWIDMSDVSINDAWEFSWYWESEVLGWISFN